MSFEFYTNEEIIRAAHRRLAQGPWDYLSGGTESETSLRRNRLAFDRLALRQPAGWEEASLVNVLFHEEAIALVSSRGFII